MSRRHHGNPILTHEIAHQRRRADAGQAFIFLAGEIVQLLAFHLEHAFGFHGFVLVMRRSKICRALGRSSASAVWWATASRPYTSFAALALLAVNNLRL